MNLNISEETLKKIIEALPEEEKKAVSHILDRKSMYETLDRVKSWINKVDIDEKLDFLIIGILDLVIPTIGGAIEKFSRERKEQGEESCPMYVIGAVAVSCLREVANDYASVLNKSAEMQICEIK